VWREEAVVTLHLSDTVVINDGDIQERFIRSDGSGGTNLHHKATAVELRYDVAHAALPDEVKARLLALAGRHVTTAGVLIVTSRLAVSQKVNRDAAHGRLLSLLLRAARPVKARKPTRPRGAVRARRLAGKRTHGEVKRLRHLALSDQSL
jgi:ribosome-associated protein